jgi:hypothetical protein
LRISPRQQSSWILKGLRRRTKVKLVVQNTVNGIGQTDKQANNAAKDLVKRFLSDTRKLEKRNG